MRRLVVSQSGKEVKTYEINEGVNLLGRWDPTTGSFPEIDLEDIDTDAKASRKHALLIKDGDHLMLEDAGSLNGTFLMNPVDGSQTKLEVGRKYPLRVGDHFVVGTLLFRIE